MSSISVEWERKAERETPAAHRGTRDLLLGELARAADRIAHLALQGRVLEAKGEALAIRVGWREYPGLSEVLYLALQTTLRDAGVEFDLPFLPCPAAAPGRPSPTAA
jgi:hypothetical protein